MTVSELIAKLSATSVVTSGLSSSVIGTAPRGPAIYAQALPRGYTMPALVVHRYDDAQDQSLLGPVDVREDSLQIDIYGNADADCEGLYEALRVLLVGFKGTMPSGTVVLNTYLEQSRDVPYLPSANSNSQAFRSMLGVRFVSKV